MKGIKSNLRNKLRPLLNKYHQYKYWNNIASSMIKNKNEKITANKAHPYKNPGIALSFDDSFRVDHWYNYGKELFGYYNVKVTFNINAYHHFENQREHTQKEIDKLLELQANGHEIAHHGFKHKRATHYSNEHGIDTWLEDEINALFNWMEKQSHSITGEKFKSPITYAFPHFVYDEEHIKALIPKYFKIVRGHLCGDNLSAFNYTGFAPSICIDRHILNSEQNIKKILKTAKLSGKNLILTCHSILPESIDWNSFGWGEKSRVAGNWRISPDTLQMLINVAKILDMPFYTTAELAGVATFIDRNFEMFVRKRLQTKGIKWISIEELNSFKSLDISNQNIANLDGIEYFTNLESLNISNNPITDLRLLERLPRLKNVTKGDKRIIREA